MNSEYTESERNARNDYYKDWRLKNPESCKAHRRRYWEKKAAKRFGADYKGPQDDETLSDQAKQVQREYYAELRRKNPERAVNAQKEFWRRRAINH